MIGWGLYRYIFLEDTCTNIKDTKKIFFIMHSNFETVITHLCIDKKNFKKNWRVSSQSP